jgi:hypothetical protein
VRVTFPRLADHQPGFALIERDDGVIYRLPFGSHHWKLPHDLGHLVVEDALRIPDGIWGAIAGGIVWGNMFHHAGRRPPHAADRSRLLQRIHHLRLQRAELLGGLADKVADAPRSLDGIRRLAREALATLPDQEIDPVEIAAAAEALRAAKARWREMPVGEVWTCLWPVFRKVSVPRPARRHERASRGGH